MKNYNIIFFLLFALPILLHQCENPSKSQEKPEIIFSNPYFTIIELDSNKIEYNFELEFMVTTRHCQLRIGSIEFNGTGVISAYDVYGSLEPMKNYKLFDKIGVDEINYSVEPEVKLALYDMKNKEDVIAECIIIKKE